MRIAKHTLGIFGVTPFGPLSALRFTVALLLAQTLSASTEISDPRHLVSITRTDLPNGEIVTNRTTWLVVHGWNSSAAALNIKNLSSALASARPWDQVLVLDWSKLADTGIDPCPAAANIVPVAAWVAPTLSAYGFQPETLNLIGHSFGSYVADEIAKRMPSKVRSLVALDPAANACGNIFDPVFGDQIDFARDAIWSWAFHASSLGNEYVPVRAHEAFIVDSGLPSADAHSAVVNLFAYMISHQSDPFSSEFGLDNLLDDGYGPWVPDTYISYFAIDKPVKGYEAIIYDPNGIQPTQLAYVPTAPALSTFVAPRTTESEFAVVFCSASDASRGNSGISEISINGLRLPNSAATGANTAASRVVIWLQPGANTIEVVAADAFYQSTTTTNILSITRSSQAGSTAPGIDIAQSSTENTVTIQIHGPLGESTSLESSTNLEQWLEVARSASIPTLITLSDATGPYGLYYGNAKLTLPRAALNSKPQAFYRAKLKP